MIQTITYTLPQSSTITNAILKKYIKMLWNDVFKPLHSKNNNIHLLLLCKVVYTDSTVGYRTLADMRKVNFSDREMFTEYLIDRLGILADSYKDNPFSKIVFTYIVRDGIADNNRRLLHQEKYEVTTHVFNNMVLPLTMDPNKYGEIIGTQVINNNESIRYIIENDTKYIFKIEASNDGSINKVHIAGPADLSWVDTRISDNTFKREIGKNTLYIKDGVITIKAKQLSAKPFKTIKPESKITPVNTFMTFDIETVNINGELHPYLICGYTGDNYIHSYASDVSKEAQSEMFTNFIKQILLVKNVKNVYAHNL